MYIIYYKSYLNYIRIWIWSFRKCWSVIN